MSDVLHDLRYAIRMLGKRPGGSLLAIGALAIGIGLTATMFAVVEGVILRGLPYDQSARIVSVLRGQIQDPASRQSVTLHDFIDWRARQKTLEALAAHADAPAVMAADSILPERLRATRMTPDLLTVLRVAPVEGRGFSDADALPGAPAVALISHRHWHSRFGGRREAIGSMVRVNGVPTTVIGVTPEKFDFPGGHDLWMPLALERPARRGDGMHLNVVGRMRDGVTVGDAATEFAGVAKQLADAFPENRDITARVRLLADEAVPRPIRLMFYAMFAAVLGVLLIACVNVTNLQLARAAERSGEYAIRSALGSSAWRLARQSLAEAFVLSACGAALGLAIAYVGATYVMTAIGDVNPPTWIDIRVDAMVLVFVIAMTAVSALLSSLAPGLRVRRLDVNGILKSSGAGGAGTGGGPFGRWLVVLQVAVSCVLLMVSGLMVRSILMTSRVDHPFATKDVLYAQVRLDSKAHADVANVTAVVRELESLMSGVAGVRRIAIATSAPGATASTSVTIEGLEAPTGRRQSAGRIAATPGYFDVLRVGMREGRSFGAGDIASAPLVAVVDDAFAERYLAPGPSLGRRIRFGDASAPWLTVIGVVPSLARRTEAGQVIETVYVPFAQAPERSFAIFVHTSGEPAALAGAVRAAVAERAPDTALDNVDSLAAEYWKRGWMFRLFGGLFLVFGAAALLLAAAGLYGVMAVIVTRRTQEIGVRLALGANRGTVLRMVLWQGLRAVMIGLIIGVWPGWFLGTLMEELAAGVSPVDPIVLAATAATLGVSGTLACLVPALRASKVTPLTAIRG
jgi:putative ABC transport system permease protein